jgi:hypothetical protein
MVHRPTSPGPPCVDPVHGINCWKIIRYSDYSEILQRGPWTFVKSTHGPDFADFALRRHNPAIELACPPFLSPAPWSKLSGTGVAGGRAAMSSSGRQWRPVHGGLEPRWSTTRGPSSRNSQFKYKSKIQLFWHFALRPLSFFKIKPQSMILQLGPGI